MSKLKLSALHLAIGSTLLSGFAFNASAADGNSAEDIERIEVTGSSIKGTDLATALPVNIISQEDIKKTGVVSTADLIAQLPAMQGFTTPVSSVGGGGGGSATAALRGLDDEYTLVLLNGRRIAPVGSGGAIDLNSIPLSAIERVEVLTDGASALYGADAIAGVVNFILKTEVDETSISARYDAPQDGGESYNLGFVTGIGDLDNDGYNLVLSASYDVREQLAAVDRDFAKTGLLELVHNDQQYFSLQGSPNAIAGNAFILDKDNNFIAAFNPAREANGTCDVNTAADVDGTDWCMFDYTSTLQIYPESDRASITVSGEAKLTDEVNLFSTLGWSDFTQTTRIAPFPTGTVDIPVGGALYNQYIEPNLTDEQQSNLGETVFGLWRGLPGGNRTTEWNTESTHLIVGSEGTLFDTIDFNTALVFSESERKQSLLDGYYNRDKFNAGTASGEIDIFASMADFSQSSQDTLNAAKHKGLEDTTTTTMTSFDVRASQPLFELPAGEVYVGYGFDLRRNEYEQVRSELNKADTRLGDGGGDRDYKLVRDTEGAFVEFQIPVLESLSLSTALRYDNIGGVTDEILGKDIGKDQSDTTYKVSFRWEASDNVVVRGSVGTGFRAATMKEIGEPRVAFGVTSAAYSCPLPASDPRAAGCLPTDIQYLVFNEGNPNLKPERSEQATFGFIYSPTTDVTMKMDYWSVEIEDQITRPQQAAIFANPEQFTDLIILDEDPNTKTPRLAIIQSAVNIGKSEASGIDWQFDVKNDFSFGTLKSTLGGTYMIDSRYTQAGTADVWRSSLGKYGEDEEVVFRNNIQFINTLTHGDFSHTLLANFKSGWADGATDVQRGTIANPERDADGNLITDNIQRRVGGQTTVNYQLLYTGIDSMSITAGVKNMFDKAPPMSIADPEGHLVGYEGRYYDQFGRTMFLDVNYRF